MTLGILCGDTSDGRQCGIPIGLGGNGPAYAYPKHYKCQKHRDRYEALHTPRKQVLDGAV